MSIFSELLPKLEDISNPYRKNFEDALKVAFECFDKFEDEFRNERNRTGVTNQKEKIGMTTLQSINEDECEPNKAQEAGKQSSTNGSSGRGSAESIGERKAPKKRSKHEVDDMFSPELDKRQKRSASVKAQSIIAKQVNTNLTAKLRRENSSEKVEVKASRTRRLKDEEKENVLPNVPAIKIKEEKISLPPEVMDTDQLPMNVELKQEMNKDDIAMPPPPMPVPKPRKGVAKEKSEDSGDEESGKRRPRNRKPAETVPPPVSGTRSTRASNRARNTDAENAPQTQPLPETRPKRTRAKKKVPGDIADTDSTQSSQESVSATASPAEKPRPKRTRRGKAAEKEPPKPVELIFSPKEERISQPEISSPILQKSTKSKKDKNLTNITIESKITPLNETRNITMDKTHVIGLGVVDNTTVSKDTDKDNIVDKDTDKDNIVDKGIDKDITTDKVKSPVKTKEMENSMVLSNGVYNNGRVSPKNARVMNETVVIEECTREIVIEKTQKIMNATVTIDKGQPKNLTDDNSLITDDESEREIETPPKKDAPITQPSSAVKEKVQQFEELASRVTRTKTRAMAKKEDQEETHTPPDKISKPILSVETLTKMNSLIFNGKSNLISSSASKPRAVTTTKSMLPASTSKLNSISKHREAAEESQRTSEDARKKKEAMLEAKREMHKRKREEKMAAAAAVRSAAERERQLALEAAARDKMEKQAHADAGKLERIKEQERKKQELARKVAETEERRKAEEAARMQRLAEEQKRALALRKKQLEEQEAMKREEAIMQKEMEKRQREYNEKQKRKQKREDKMHTPLKTPTTPSGHSQMEPVYMLDGFQYLNSDEDEEPPLRPVPDWSTSKARKHQLDIQSHIAPVHVERLFSVRVHSPDLRDIFPNIERARLKRTSSAVWRTPPRLGAVAE